MVVRELSREAYEQVLSACTAPVPVEQLPVWLDYQKTIEGRSPWGYCSVESDGQVVEGGKVTYTYKKKSGLFDFLGTTQSGFPTEPGEYVQTAKAAGNYSSSEISRTIVIQ